MTQADMARRYILLYDKLIALADLQRRLCAVYVLQNEFDRAAKFARRDLIAVQAANRAFSHYQRLRSSLNLQ